MTYQTANSSLSHLQVSSKKLQYCTVCKRYWQRLQTCEPTFCRFHMRVLLFDSCYNCVTGEMQERQVMTSYWVFLTLIKNTVYKTIGFLMQLMEYFPNHGVALIWNLHSTTWSFLTLTVHNTSSSKFRTNQVRIFFSMDVIGELHFSKIFKSWPNVS